MRTRVRSSRAGAGGAVVLLVVGVAAAAFAVGSLRGHALPPRAAGWSAVPEAARGVVSARLGTVEPAYRATVVRGGVTVHNRRNRLRARFAASGVAVVHGGRDLGLALTGFGRGTLAPVAPADPVARSNRVSYRHRDLVEWYLNGPLGIEQGFTIRARPAGTSGGVRLALALSGRLAAVARPVRGGVRFGQLLYSGLVARDARGTVLPSRLALAHGRLVISVDDASARYPVTVDPYLQLARLTGASGAAGDTAGFAVGVAGDTIVVGAPGTNGSRGAVLVFTRPATGWADATQTATLTASDGAVGDGLGASVAISSDGSTIVAGSPSAGVGSNASQGAAYVFAKPGGGWTTATQTAKLTASDGATGDNLGHSVAVSGTTVVAGAPSAKIGANVSQGAAYVFTEPGGGWTTATQTAKLTASGGAAGDALGSSIAVDATTVVVGAFGVSSGRGAAYVYVQTGGAWSNATQTATLIASDAANGDALGGAVAISGGTIVAGANFAQVGANAGQGAVYVYVKPGGGWANATETTKLTASDGAAQDDLGFSVAIDSNTVVAGADGAGGNQGAAYVFADSGGVWSQSAKLTDSGGASGDLLGSSVAVSGATVVAGSIGRNTNTGAAEVFSTQTVPGAPTGVSGVAGNASVVVSWSAPSSTGGATITGYTVTASGGGGTCTWSSGPLTCTVSGLTNGTPYTFTVTATNAAGTGPASTASSAVTPAAAGTSASLSTVSSSRATVVDDGSDAATVTVTLKDGGGSPVSGHTVTLTPGSGSSVVSAASGPSSASGVVTFTVTDANLESVTYTAADTTAAVTLTQTVSVQFSVPPCTAGSYWSSGVCVQASPGFFVAGSGATTQSACPVGTFAAGTGNTACTIAPVGTYVSSVAADSVTACPVDTYAAVTGSAGCTPCPSRQTTAKQTGQDHCVAVLELYQIYASTWKAYAAVTVKLFGAGLTADTAMAWQQGPSGGTCGSVTLGADAAFLTCTIPAGSLAPGIPVTMTATSGAQRAHNDPDQTWTPRIAPTITSVAPRSGPAGTAHTVTIQGMNFGVGSAGIGGVTYGAKGTGSACMAPMWISTTSLVCTLGADVAAGTSVSFIVSVLGVASDPSTETYTADQPDICASIGDVTKLSDAQKLKCAGPGTPLYQIAHGSGPGAGVAGAILAIVGGGFVISSDLNTTISQILLLNGSASQDVVLKVIVSLSPSSNTRTTLSRSSQSAKTRSGSLAAPASRRGRLVVMASGTARIAKGAPLRTKLHVRRGAKAGYGTYYVIETITSVAHPRQKFSITVKLATVNRRPAVCKKGQTPTKKRPCRKH